MGHCHAILWPNLLNYRFTDEDIMNGHPIIFAIASVVCILCIRDGRGAADGVGPVIERCHNSDRVQLRYRDCGKNEEDTNFCHTIAESNVEDDTSNRSRRCGETLNELSWNTIMRFQG